MRAASERFGPTYARSSARRKYEILVSNVLTNPPNHGINSARRGVRLSEYAKTWYPTLDESPKAWHKLSR
jgi:hypothetical protein